MKLDSDKEGVAGRIADERAVSAVLPAQVDVGMSVSWPTSVRDGRFEEYLEDLNILFSLRPSAADATVDLDEVQIGNDVEFIKKYVNVKSGLEELVRMRHDATLHSRLNVDCVRGFEEFPKYQELRRLAEHGAQAHLREDFQFNRGVGDFLRPQARMLRASIRHHYGKLQRKGWCIIVPKELVEGMDGVHVSPTHVACKRGDTKGRCCVDENASGLNDATDMDAIEARLGQMSLPGLQQLSTMLHRAWCGGARALFKTDVSSAFNRIKLSFEAVMSQATQVDTFIVFPLVAVFGWTASPVYYSLAADAVHWAHNGGVTGQVLDSWRRAQGKSVEQRPQGDLGRFRSVTYVDDTFGPIMPDDGNVPCDDADTIICRLHAADGVNQDKCERGPRLTCLGWHIDMELATIRPSDRGIQKMLWWCFRKMSGTTSAVLLHDLQSLVSLLRWYAVVIPLAYGALQGLAALLAKAQRGRQHSQWVHLDGASRKDLEFWRWLLDLGLRDQQLWSTPLWFLAGELAEREVVYLFTDACTSIGGGFVLDGHSFGQFRWEEDEKRFFSSMGREETDINILEFVVAVLAVVVEREYLSGKVVILRVDNTAAVSWLNKHRLNHMWGQCWMRLLTMVSLRFNIRLVCKHIAGVINFVADGLSRCVQETSEQLRRSGLTQRQVPAYSWRERWWTQCGETALWQEWQAILSEPTLQPSDRSSGTSNPCVGWSPTLGNR